MGREERRGKRKSRQKLCMQRIPELGYYYIVTDTNETEKNYLEGLRDSISDEFKNKIVIKVVKSRTINLVETCINDSSLYPQYCEPWIVFDRDQVKNFDDIILNAKKHGIRVGWSNPCIESWFLAYFGSMPTIQNSVSCCKQFAIEYKRRVGKKYDKAQKDLYNELNHYGDEKRAVEIARSKRKVCVDNGVQLPSQMIPCTTIDILITEIKIKAIKKENQT